MSIAGNCRAPGCKHSAYARSGLCAWHEEFEERLAAERQRQACKRFAASCTSTATEPEEPASQPPTHQETPDA